MSATVLRPFAEPEPASTPPKDEAATLAEGYGACPHCGAKPQVADTVSVRHGLLCPVRARILQMRIRAAA
jgi:hypothetical protein